MEGVIHSIQSLGTVDGPGVRFVVFMQGCPLRCAFCHNPDTWDTKNGQRVTAEALLQKALRYREYFGEKGGVTVTGGEPLLQADFVTEFFTRCKAEGLHTCLDTSGVLLTESVGTLLSVTDRVLLDVKFTEDALYKTHVGCSLENPLAFLAKLEEKRIPTTIRQVIVPSFHDTEKNLSALAALVKAHTCVDNVELLPFRKLCTPKYEAMGIPFPFGDMPTPTESEMAEIRKKFNMFCDKK